MGEAGNSEEEIRRQGRWSSQAFTIYTKKDRSLHFRSQLGIMREISEKLKRD